MAKQFKRAYPASMSSINALELRCEEDEGDLTAKLISMNLGVGDNNSKVTGAIYEEVSGMMLGHLIFEEYTTEVDAGSRQALHEIAKEPFVCKGRAYLKGVSRNIIVFRNKPGDTEDT